MGGARDVGDLAERWDEWHRGRDRLEQVGSLPARAPWREMALGLLPATIDGLRVIDIGCARGGFSRDLADLGAELTSVDISTVALELTRRQLGHRKARLLRADVRALPFADETFDVAVCLQTPGHVAEPQAVVAEAVRVTRSSGLIVLSIQNQLSLMGLSRLGLRLLARRERPPVERSWTLPALLRTLRSRGCSIEAVEGEGHLVMIPGRPTVHLRRLERYRAARHFAYHSCVAARKPVATSLRIR